MKVSYKNIVFYSICWCADCNGVDTVVCYQWYTDTAGLPWLRASLFDPPWLLDTATPADDASSTHCVTVVYSLCQSFLLAFRCLSTAETKQSKLLTCVCESEYLVQHYSVEDELTV